MLKILKIRKIIFQSVEGTWKDLEIPSNIIGTYTCNVEEASGERCKNGAFTATVTGSTPVYNNWWTNGNTKSEPNGLTNKNHATIRKNGDWEDTLGTDTDPNYVAICFKRLILSSSFG